MKIEDKIATAILANRVSGYFTIIAVCGAADLGKSYLSSMLVNAINELGVTAGHVTLDSFMLNREDRISKEISGYEPEAYDFFSLTAELEKFTNGQGLSFFPYNHSTGKKERGSVSIRSCDVLIVDGLHSMHETLNSFITKSLFVYTDDALLRKIRLEADLVKRKQSIATSQKTEPKEFEKYKKFVEPYKKSATWHLFLEKKWEFSFQNNMPTIL